MIFNLVLSADRAALSVSATRHRSSKVSPLGCEEHPDSRRYAEGPGEALVRAGNAWPDRELDRPVVQTALDAGASPPATDLPRHILRAIALGR